MTDKPNLTRVWANGAAPTDIIDPDTTTPGKFNLGWSAEIPPFEHFNFIQKMVTQALAHINEVGIAQWDENTNYQIRALVRGSDNNIYRSVIGGLVGAATNPITLTNRISGNYLWEEVSLGRSGIQVWSSSYVYDINSHVLGADGEIYKSRTNNNIGIPVANPTHWKNLYKDYMERSHPVGSIYENFSDSTNPSVLLGFGTWAPMGSARVTIGVGSHIDSNGVSQSFPAQSTGGAFNTTLTVGQIPAHTHEVTYHDVIDGQSGTFPGGTNIVGQSNLTRSTSSIGGGLPHTNVQPWVTVYRWYRTI